MQESATIQIAAATVSAIRLTLELARAQLSSLALADGRTQIIEREDGPGIIPPPNPGSGLHALFATFRSIEDSLQHIVGAGGSEECSMLWIFDSPDALIVSGGGKMSSHDPDMASKEATRLLQLALSSVEAQPEAFRPH
jgi:hypothetical protein